MVDRPNDPKLLAKLPSDIVLCPALLEGVRGPFTKIQKPVTAVKNHRAIAIEKLRSRYAKTPPEAALWQESQVLDTLVTWQTYGFEPLHRNGLGEFPLVPLHSAVRPKKENVSSVLKSMTPEQWYWSRHDLYSPEGRVLANLASFMNRETKLKRVWYAREIALPITSLLGTLIYCTRLAKDIE